MLWAAKADTVASMADGTMNTSPINFSTIPTAAASISPRPLAITVMTIKATWMKPSCRATGTPMLKIRAMPRRCKRRSRPVMCNMARWRRITTSDTNTLAICESVVLRAAPIGPNPM